MRYRITLLMFFLTLTACGRTAAVQTAPAPTPNPGAEIIALLEASTEAWNRSDLEGFLEPYLDSPQTTFAGGSGLLEGKEAIRESYLGGYWDSGVPEGLLRFRDIRVRPLGPDHALAVGRYVVADRDTGEETGTGLFSLVLTRTAEGWRIIHDHSS